MGQSKSLIDYCRYDKPNIRQARILPNVFHCEITFFENYLDITI